MEKKIRSVFEYQKFAQNNRLANLIEQTEARMGKELSDDSLELVSAAGEIILDETKDIFENENNK